MNKDLYIFQRYCSSLSRSQLPASDTGSCQQSKIIQGCGIDLVETGLQVRGKVYRTPWAVLVVCLSPLLRPLVGKPLKSVAWPVQTWQTYGYLPSRGHCCPVTGTKLPCLVTEAHVCKQLAQSRYLAAERPWVEAATSQVASQRLNHYTKHATIRGLDAPPPNLQTRRNRHFEAKPIKS